MLVESPGQLISREEFHRALWPADTFVGFDQGLNSAVKKIRNVLNDSAETPRYIETLPRLGYRFVGEVIGRAEANVPNSPYRNDAIEEPSRNPAPVGVPIASQPRLPLRIVSSAVVVLGLAGLGIYLFSSRAPATDLGIQSIAVLPPENLSPTIEVVPLTGSSGYELTPSFSPDGNQVAFVLKGSHSPGIYTALVGGEKPLRLTSNPGDRYPRWSPWKANCFFASIARGPGDLLNSCFGRHRTAGVLQTSHDFSVSLDWRPDGKALAFSQSDSDQTHAHISLLSLVDSSIRQITSPSEQELDFAPAFSPDGFDARLHPDASLR